MSGRALSGLATDLVAEVLAKLRSNRPPHVLAKPRNNRRLHRRPRPLTLPPPVRRRLQCLLQSAPIALRQGAGGSPSFLCLSQICEGKEQWEEEVPVKETMQSLQ